MKIRAWTLHELCEVDDKEDKAVGRSSKKGRGDGGIGRPYTLVSISKALKSV